jgi:FkbM family methyltransferase
LERVTPLECNPAILHILKANLGLNWHPSFDLSHLGKGLSDHQGEGRIAAFNPLNIGGTRFNPARGDDGERPGIPIPMFAGDDDFAPGDFDFIKMDIEGVELVALRGMSRFISAFRRLLFIEVQDENATEFAQYVAGAASNW